MKTRYTSPAVTVDLFETEDVITVSLHSVARVIRKPKEEETLPHVDADEQNYT